MNSGVAHGGKQDTANERARAGTHEGALTCGCCSEGKEGKEGRKRETEELAVCLTETGLVASSCNEKGRYVGCALFRDRGLVIRRGLTGNTGVCPGSHTTERRVAAREKPRNKRVREFGGSYSGEHVRCTGT